MAANVSPLDELYCHLHSNLSRRLQTGAGHPPPDRHRPPPTQPAAASHSAPAAPNAAGRRLPPGAGRRPPAFAAHRRLPASEERGEEQRNVEKMRGEEEMEKIRCREKTERGGGGVEIEDFIAWEDEVRFYCGYLSDWYGGDELDLSTSTCGGCGCKRSSDFHACPINPPYMTVDRQRKHPAITVQ
uniref:Uncharacterized protein n=1 Tax=Oryza sativa subsp. japonica TaxID=39947 RepID=Q6AVH3_ORYSJ|nr:hypothetical protein [Oryza sativa Japonica Group]